MQHNPITLRRRQEIISAFSTNTCAMSRRPVLRIRKISTKGYLLALNSENQINRKCIEDSKEYNYWDVKSDRVNVPVCSRHSWSWSLPTVRVNEGKMYCAGLDYEIKQENICSLHGIEIHVHLFPCHQWNLLLLVSATFWMTRYFVAAINIFYLDSVVEWSIQFLNAHCQRSLWVTHNLQDLYLLKKV